MPLPAPPPLKRHRHTNKAVILALPLEERPLVFPELEEALYDKDIRKQTGLRCRTCLHFQRCTLGPQQMLACFGYFLWHPHVSTTPARAAQAHVLQTCPLTERVIASLSVQDLLGVYALRGYSVWTLVDITRRGLRARLHLIQGESAHPSPYRLTTE